MMVYMVLSLSGSLGSFSLVFCSASVTLGRNEEVSADYPGRVVQHPDEMGYESIFLCGCSGDIDPRLLRGAGELVQRPLLTTVGVLLRQPRRLAKKAEPMQNVTRQLQLAVELPATLDKDVIRKKWKSRGCEGRRPSLRPGH